MEPLLLRTLLFLLQKPLLLLLLLLKLLLFNQLLPLLSTKETLKALLAHPAMVVEQLRLPPDAALVDKLLLLVDATHSEAVATSFVQPQAVVAAC